MWIKFIFFLLYTRTASTQICTKWSMVPKKQILLVGGEIKTITKIDRRLERYCCAGYQAVNGTCVAQCENECVNGDCSSPNNCDCHEGYTMVSHFVCSPLCDTDCFNGYCEAPNKCGCNKGYSLNLASQKCELACNDGYEKTNANECVPKCEGGCHHGFCSSPGTCECIKGYTNMTSQTCKPFCKDGCLNGFCAAPGVCNCSNGYAKTSFSTTCEPVCKTGCFNGVCIAPEVCICNSGYSKTIQDICQLKIAEKTYFHAITKTLWFFVFFSLPVAFFLSILICYLGHKRHVSMPEQAQRYVVVDMAKQADIIRVPQPNKCI